MIEIKVLGVPATQGSHTAFVKQGKPVIIEGGNPTARRKLSDWRQAIRSEAQRVVSDVESEYWGSPLELRASFTLAKPSSAPKRRRTWPIASRSGDIDKLARAVLDALTGVLFADDSQIVTLCATKDYGMPLGVLIQVIRLKEAE